MSEAVINFPQHNAEWDRQVNLDAVSVPKVPSLWCRCKTLFVDAIRNFRHPDGPAKGEKQGEFSRRMWRRLNRKLRFTPITLPDREPIVWDCINRMYVATEDAVLWSEFTDANDMNELRKKDGDFARAKLAELKQKYGVK